MYLFYEDSFYQGTYSLSYSSFKVVLSLQSVWKGLQMMGSTEGRSFTSSFDSHLLHHIHEEHVTFDF